MRRERKNKKNKIKKEKKSDRGAQKFPMKSRVPSKLAARNGRAGGCTRFDGKRKPFRYRWMVSALRGCRRREVCARAGRALIARELIKL